MKSLNLFVFLLIVSIATAFGGSARGIYNSPKNPGKCTIKENLVLSPGDIVKDPDLECGQIICAQIGLALFHSCKMEVLEGCKMGAYINKSLPYPYCCKRNVICS